MSGLEPDDRHSDMRWFRRISTSEIVSRSDQSDADCLRSLLARALARSASGPSWRGWPALRLGEFPVLRRFQLCECGGVNEVSEKAAIATDHRSHLR